MTNASKKNVLLQVGKNLGALGAMLPPLKWGVGPTHGSHHETHTSCERREHYSQSM